MSILLDIGVNLIAALIGFGLGWVWQNATQALRQRKARQFWKPFLNDNFQIVVGRFSEFTPFEPSGFLGIGDAIGLAELRSYFQTLGSRDFTVSYADRLSGDSLKTNLILIGGPDANTITKEAVERIKSTLRFGNPKEYVVAIYDTADKKIYAPLRGKDSEEIVLDYGVIIKTVNPFAPNKQVLIVAGSFGYGTWAGIRYALSNSLAENPIASKGKPVECLIETDVVRDTPQDIRLITLRTLESDGRKEQA